MGYENLMAGTYFIRVYGSSSTEGDYSISNTFTATELPNGNDTENNDEVENSLILALDGSATGHIGYYQDGYTDSYDWYSVNIPYDGRLMIVTESEAILNLSMELYDIDSVSYLRSCTECGGLGENDTLIYENLMAGTYFVRLYHSINTQGSYTIKNQFTETEMPLDNDSEPNDVVQNSLTLALNGSKKGHMGFYSDGYTDSYDWYSVTIPYDGQLMIVTESETTLNLSMELYDVDSVSYLRSCTECGGLGENDTLIYENLMAGTYFVRLYHSFGAYGSYTIKNSFTATELPTGNDTEPNNTYTNAIPLELNKDTSGHLRYYQEGVIDEYDWYAVTLTGTSDLTVALNPGNNLDLSIELFNTDGSSYLSSCDYCGGTGINDTLNHTDLAAGTYYLKLFGSGYGSYTIIASTTGLPAAFSAAFSADITSGDMPLSVNFTDMSTGTPTSWEWDFDNDGSTDATTQNPSYTFNTSGNFTVSLTISDGTNSDTETKTDYITVNPSSGSALNLPYEENFEISSGILPESYTLIDIDEDGYNFKTSNVLSLEGSYSCMVYTGGSAGHNWIVLPKLALTAAKTITLDFKAKSEYGSYPETFEVLVSTTTTDTASFTSVSDVNTVPASTTTYSFDLTDYSGQECYIAIRHKTDKGWRFWIDALTVTASDPEGITADFSANTTSGTTPLSVDFTDQSTGTATSWAWDFDNDGIIDATIQNPSHTYNNEETYTVKLIVNDGSNEDTITKVDFITVGASGSSSDGKWEIIPSGISSYDFEDVFFLNETTGWAAGESGTLVKTSDAGKTWTEIETNSYNNFDGIWFFDENTGFATTEAGGFSDPHGEILKTTNGGANWTMVKSHTNFLYDIAFYNENIGWAVGSSGSILYTSNGGTDWSVQTSGITQIIRNVSILNSTTAIVTTDGTTTHSGMLKTTNSGTTWTDISLGNTYDHYGISFIDDSKGWTSGTSGKTYYTTNGGSNWTISQTEVSTTLYQTHFASATHGVAVGLKGTTLSTNDGGITWVRDSITDNRLDACWTINEHVAIGVGMYGTIVRYSDGNEAPEIEAAFTADVTSGSAPLSVSFTDQSIGDITSWAWDFDNDGKVDASIQNPSHVYNNNGKYDVKLIVGNGTSNDTILKSAYISVTQNGSAPADTGSTVVPSHTFADLFSVSFPSESTGYAVGDSGTIVKTTDGGETWAKQTSGVTNTLLSVFFVNENIGFATGEWNSGSHTPLLKTTDGGATWNNINPGAYADLFDIHFVSSTVGYIAGKSDVFKTTDAGDTWTKVTNPVSSNTTYPYTIIFTDENTGYLGTKSSTSALYKTTDGGITWSRETSDGDAIYDIQFIDANTGFAATLSKIKTTTDADRWSAQSSTGIFGINAMYFVDESTGYVIGDDGDMRKTTDAANTWKDVFIDVTENLNNVEFINDTTAIIVGDNGTIVKYIGTNKLELEPITAVFSASTTTTNVETSVSFTDESTGTITSWQWDFDNDGNIDATEQNPSYTYTASGTYTVALIISDGTQSDTLILNDYISVSTTMDVNSLSQASSFEVYPNPASENVFVHIDIANGCTVGNLQIMDVNGKIVFNENMDLGNNTKLNISHLEKGVYFIRFKETIKKIIVQ